MLETIDLTKQYENGVLAVDHLNLKVQPGEIFTMLGANGAGKTTTINLLLNFTEPTAGEASINGVNVVKDPLEAKKHVAYVSENMMLPGIPNWDGRRCELFDRGFGKGSEKFSLFHQDFQPFLIA